MSWKNKFEPYLARMPMVDRPDGHVKFKRKLMWSSVVVLVYFILTNIGLVGMGGGGQDVFGQFRSVIAGEAGTLMQVGIGPIVTGSIVMQLLSGANLLGLNTNSDPRDQVLYQGLQKIIVIVVTALTAAGFVGAGFIPVSNEFANAFGVGTEVIQLLLFAQLFIGGVLIVFMDEVVSKWGIGSGIGLFIIAGVSQRIIGGIFGHPVISESSGLIHYWYTVGIGRETLPSIFTQDGFTQVFFGEGQILAIFTTVIIFLVVVIAESIRVEIPLQHARVKGARGTFPIKLIYASVLPMILVRAVQLNIQFMGQIINSRLNAPDWFGVYAGGEPTSGLMYYLNPIQAPQDWMWWLGFTSQDPLNILARVFTDLTIMVIGGAIFAIFWVQTTEMGPKSVSKQIQGGQMQIPGFRKSPKIYEKLLERYIPQVTVIGGALVGLLAVTANLMGTIGTVDGIGLLLSISIIYRLYEEIMEEQLMEMHPAVRKMFQK